MATLQDPTLPAGHLVEVREDGSALRNDGVELSPAGQNPWYVLATVYGEPESIFDRDVIANNRRIWNGWACQGKTDEERAVLAKSVGLPVKELGDLTDAEWDQVKEQFSRRLGAGAEIPKLTHVHMSEIHCHNTVVLPQCIFPGYADFSSSTFSGDADFSSSTFSGDADFSSSTFSGGADFSSSTFSGYADFSSSTFSGYAGFSSSTFSGYADFRSSTFSGYADFRSSTFSGYAYFSSSTFSGYAGFLSSTFSGYAYFNSSTFSGSAYFSSSTFSGYTDFSNQSFDGQTAFVNTNFNGSVPKFYQRDFHQDTEFTTNPDNWPAITAENANESKRAYTRLRKVMNELQNPDDEHFFFRQEMECKRHLENWWNRVPIHLFKWLSDYGHSVTRPIAWLAGIVVIGGAVTGSYLRTTGIPGNGSIWQGLGVSFSNTFPFLGFTRKMHPGFFEKAPAWLDALSAGQSILGVILLFFLGLGLRNRFRIK